MINHFLPVFYVPQQSTIVPHISYTKPSPIDRQTDREREKEREREREREGEREREREQPVARNFRFRLTIIFVYSLRRTIILCFQRKLLNDIPSERIPIAGRYSWRAIDRAPCANLVEDRRAFEAQTRSDAREFAEISMHVYICTHLDSRQKDVRRRGEHKLKNSWISIYNTLSITLYLGLSSNVYRRECYVVAEPCLCAYRCVTAMFRKKAAAVSNGKTLRVKRSINNCK